MQDRLAGRVDTMEVGIRKQLEKFGFARDEDGLKYNLAENSVAVVETPKISTNTSMETP